jgi:lipoprotein-anchoring transpeptidase ErfK/SrfK
VPRARTQLSLAIAALAAIPAVALGQGTGTTPATPQFPPGVIASGVTIGGVDVSNLPALDARQRLFDQFVAPRRAPLQVTFRGKSFTIAPDAVGYRADVDAAITRAFQVFPVPGTTEDVPVAQFIQKPKLREVLTWRATQYEIDGKDALVVMRGMQPIIRRAVLGSEIDVPRSMKLVEPALVSARPATPVALAEKKVRPTSTSVGPVIVIDKSAFKLRLYRGTTKPGGTIMKRVRTYPVAIGQPAYPTPTGNYAVIQKQMNPTWFPPDSPWAAGLGPVPPGASNPLGTRWIGTSAPAIGMHGTPNPSSIGTMASHGCVRMYMRDVENLYSRVEIGTPVFIRN